MGIAIGHVVQILGGVVDVEFPEGQTPQLFDAIHVDRPGKSPLVLKYRRTLARTGSVPSQWMPRTG